MTITIRPPHPHPPHRPGDDKHQNGRAPQEHSAAAERARLAISRHEAASHVAAFAQKRSWKIPVAVGAAAVILMGGLMVYLDQASKEVAATKALASPDTRVLATRLGQRANVTLRDGSQTSVGADSKLHIPAAFGTEFRVVKLEGTATFTVAEKEDMPFEVRVDGASFRATGTTFAVSAFIDEEIVLRVDEGAVDVILPGGRHSVSAPRAVAVSADGGVTDLLPGRRDESFAWIGGDFILAERPLAEALQFIRRWYGAQLMVADTVIYNRPVRITSKLGALRDVISQIESTGKIAFGWAQNNTAMVLYDSATAPKPAAPARRRR